MFNVFGYFDLFFQRLVEHIYPIQIHNVRLMIVVILTNYNITEIVVMSLVISKP